LAAESVTWTRLGIFKAYIFQQEPISQYQWSQYTPNARKSELTEDSYLSFGKIEGKTHLEDLGIDGRILK
jgi:hypothetical protein